MLDISIEHHVSTIMAQNNQSQPTRTLSKLASNCECSCSVLVFKMCPKVLTGSVDWHLHVLAKYIMASLITGCDADLSFHHGRRQLIEIFKKSAFLKKLTGNKNQTVGGDSDRKQIFHCHKYDSASPHLFSNMGRKMVLPSCHLSTESLI